MTPAHPAQPQPAPAWLPWLTLVIASALAHLGCLASQFYLDDATAILHNPLVLNGPFWLNPTLAWTHGVYWTEYRLFGMSATGFHALNWLLHTAVACGVYGLGRDFLRGRAPVGVAWVGALVFAVHPLASEIPNYARTQDLAWVTLFSLGAAWALLRFLQHRGGLNLGWMVVGIVGATLSKGPGLLHALMMTGGIGLAFMTAEHWRLLRRRGWWLAGSFLLGAGALWASGILPKLWAGTGRWGEARFIGHAYTLARVFWEFAWRAVVPVDLCADHQIAETLVPAGAYFWDIPDRGAMAAAAGVLALTVIGLLLAWRKPTRLFGVCLLLFVGTLLFRMLYLMPEFMPEYRIYPGMPWFCLGAAIALGAAWRRLAPGVSPRLPVALLVLGFAMLSARRSWQWHDLDRLTADILRQYPAQGRAVWELHDRDAAAGQWSKIIERQRQVWPQVFSHFLAENRRLAPKRELPSGHFALADVACAGRYALALAHVEGTPAGMAELRRLEAYMKQLRLDPVAHQLHWNYFFTAKALVLEQAGHPQAALDLLRREGLSRFSREDIQRLERQLKPGW